MTTPIPQPQPKFTPPAGIKPAPTSEVCIATYIIGKLVLNGLIDPDDHSEGFTLDDIVKLTEEALMEAVGVCGWHGDLRTLFHAGDLYEMTMSRQSD